METAEFSDKEGRAEEYEEEEGLEDVGVRGMLSESVTVARERNDGFDDDNLIVDKI